MLKTSAEEGNAHGDACSRTLEKTRCVGVQIAKPWKMCTAILSPSGLRRFQLFGCTVNTAIHCGRQIMGRQGLVEFGGNTG